MITLLEKFTWIRPVLVIITVVFIGVGINWCFSQLSQTVQGFLAEGSSSSQTAKKQRASSGVLALLATANQPKGLKPVNRSIPAPSGRLDPFSPLVEDPDAPGADKLLQQKPHDPLSAMEFTGLIHGRNGKDSLAMLHVNDTVLGETTVIRKAGQTFSLQGNNVHLLSVNDRAITIELNGKRSTKSLRSISDPAEDTSQTTAASQAVPATLPTLKMSPIAGDNSAYAPSAPKP